LIFVEQATIEEDKVYADKKTKIREEIRNMRHRVFAVLYILITHTHTHTHTRTYTILTTIF